MTPIYLDIQVGWQVMLLDCFQELMATSGKIEFDQIKSKFGGLRLYYKQASPEQAQICKTYEELSYSICEFCGTNFRVKQTCLTKSNWIYTICEKCLQTKNEERASCI